ncbi:serine/arginine repetitive matrix protein 2-like isoform X2 [Salvelinus alpinus]
MWFLKHSSSPAIGVCQRSSRWMGMVMEALVVHDNEEASVPSSDMELTLDLVPVRMVFTEAVRPSLYLDIEILRLHSLFNGQVPLGTIGTIDHHRCVAQDPRPSGSRDRGWRKPTKSLARYRSSTVGSRDRGGRKPTKSSARYRSSTVGSRDRGWRKPTKSSARYRSSTVGSRDRGWRKPTKSSARYRSSTLGSRGQRGEEANQVVSQVQVLHSGLSGQRVEEANQVVSQVQVLHSGLSGTEGGGSQPSRQPGTGPPLWALGDRGGRKPTKSSARYRSSTVGSRDRGWRKPTKSSARYRSSTVGSRDRGWRKPTKSSARYRSSTVGSRGQRVEEANQVVSQVQVLHCGLSGQRVEEANQVVSQVQVLHCGLSGTEGGGSQPSRQPGTGPPLWALGDRGWRRPTKTSARYRSSTVDSRGQRGGGKPTKSSARYRSSSDCTWSPIETCQQEVVTHRDLSTGSGHL